MVPVQKLLQATKQSRQSQRSRTEVENCCVQAADTSWTNVIREYWRFMTDDRAESHDAGVELQQWPGKKWGSQHLFSGNAMKCQNLGWQRFMLLKSKPQGKDPEACL